MSRSPRPEARPANWRDRLEELAEFWWTQTRVSFWVGGSCSSCATLRWMKPQPECPFRSASIWRNDAVHLGFVHFEEILVAKLLLTQVAICFRIDDSARNMLLRGGYRWNEGRSNQRAGIDCRDWRSCRWRGPKWGKIHQSGRWLVDSAAAAAAVQERSGEAMARSALRLQSQKEFHNKLVTGTIKVEGALSLLGGKVTKTCCSMIAFYLFIYFFWDGGGCRVPAAASQELVQENKNTKDSHLRDCIHYIRIWQNKSKGKRKEGPDKQTFCFLPTSAPLWLLILFSSSFSLFNQMEIHYDTLAHEETIVNALPSAVRKSKKNKRMLYGSWENKQLFFSTRKRLCKTNLPLPLRVTPGCSRASILVVCRVLTATRDLSTSGVSGLRGRRKKNFFLWLLCYNRLADTCWNTLNDRPLNTFPRKKQSKADENFNIRIPSVRKKRFFFIV